MTTETISRRYIVTYTRRDEALAPYQQSVRYAPTAAAACADFRAQRYSAEYHIVSVREDGMSDEDRRSFPS